MATPAAASVLRGNARPNIAFDLASAFEAKTALVTLGGGDATAMNAELEAYTDADGNTPFDGLGNAITEAELAAIAEARPQHGQAFVLIVNRYVYGKLS